LYGAFVRARRALNGRKRRVSGLGSGVFVGAGSLHAEPLADGAAPGSAMRGIICGHAYTVLATLETAEGVRLLQLRNPWGHGEWRGRWGDGTDVWRTPLGQRVRAAIRKQGGVGGAGEKLDDGKFWIEVEDFVERFRTLELCVMPASAHSVAPPCAAARAAGADGTAFATPNVAEPNSGEEVGSDDEHPAGGQASPKRGKKKKKKKGKGKRLSGQVV
jgi:hypothetical protein